MSTDEAPLFSGLVDDASLFPPTELPMGAALAAHEEFRSGPYADVLGRFLCPMSRLSELQQQLGERRLRLGLIADTGAADIPNAVAQVCEDRRLELEVVEVPLSPEADQARAAHQSLKALTYLPMAATGFVELPRVRGWRDALSLVAARGRGAKLRTGGMVAEAFPSELDVAAFIRACVDEGTAFKCTAGLHRAVRWTEDATGFEHHGFLNILLATCWAVRGGSVGDLAEVLAERDPADLLEELATVDAGTTVLMRRYFTAFGSCSLTEPVDDLTGLGLLEKAHA